MNAPDRMILMGPNDGPQLPPLPDPNSLPDKVQGRLVWLWARTWGCIDMPIARLSPGMTLAHLDDLLTCVLMSTAHIARLVGYILAHGSPPPAPGWPDMVEADEPAGMTTTMTAATATATTGSSTQAPAAPKTTGRTKPVNTKPAAKRKVLPWADDSADAPQPVPNPDATAASSAPQPAPTTESDLIAGVLQLAADRGIPDAFLAAHMCRSLVQLEAMKASAAPASKELLSKAMTLETAWARMTTAAGGAAVKPRGWSALHSASANPDAPLSECITVFKADEPCGKIFTLGADGSVGKHPQASVSAATARTVHVPDASALAGVLAKVSATPDAGVVLGAVKGLAPGETFRIVSMDLLAGHLRVDKSDRQKLAGVHEINGGKFVARMKENFLHSQWALLDRDIDAHTPEQFDAAHLPYADWLALVDQHLLPGAATCERVHVPSSSARVIKPDGSPDGGGNGHTFIRLTGDLAQLDRVRSEVVHKAALAGIAWSKPRKSRQTGEQIGARDATIIDPSVLAPERLVFEGAPNIGAGLSLAPTDIQVSAGAALDLDKIAGLTDADLARLNTSSTTQLHRDSNGGVVAHDDELLTWDLPIDPGTGKTLTVQEWRDAGGKRMRIQAPFRDSTSMAAFIDLDGGGRPFIYDSGTGITYRLKNPNPDPTTVFQPIAQPSVSAAGSSRAVAWPAPFPGPMTQITEAILASSHRPRPVGAMLAALSSMATACDGHVCLEDGTRLNLYVLVLMPTGGGKEKPRHAAEKIAHAAGAKVAGKPASGAGVEDILGYRRAILMAVDEAAHLLAATNGKHAPPYLIDAMAVMLKLYSASSGTYYKRALGNGGKRRTDDDDGDSGVAVENVCLCLLFFTTPEMFANSVRQINVEQGFVGRFLFHNDESIVDLRDPESAFEIPADVMKTITAIRAAKTFRPIGSAPPSSALTAQGLLVVTSPDAKLALGRCRDRINAQARAGHKDSLSSALSARTYEQVRRIAGVLAVWDMPAAPVMESRHVEWALQLVEASNDELTRFAMERLNESAVLADAQKILDVCKRILSKELSADRTNEANWVNRGKVPARLALARSKMDKARFEKAAEHLIAVGSVKATEESCVPGGDKTRLLLLLT